MTLIIQRFLNFHSQRLDSPVQLFQATPFAVLEILTLSQTTIIRMVMVVENLDAVLQLRARVGTLPNDPGNGSRNSEGSVTPQTDEKNRGGMIRPPQPLLGRDGERYFLVKGLWGTAGRLVARSSG